MKNNTDMKTSRLPLLFIAVSMVLHTIAALLTDSVPVGDFKRFYETAQQIAVGEWGFADTSYFTIWAYQTGFALYEAIVIRLSGLQAKTVLTVLNCLYIAGTTGCVYLIAEKLSANSTRAILAGVLYLAVPETYTLAPVLTNQHLALFLIMCGFCAVLPVRSERAGSRFRLSRLAIAGVLFALGNCIRPLGIIAMGSAILYLLSETLMSRVKVFVIVRVCAVLLCAYLLTIGAANAVVIGSGLNPKGLSNNDSLWKFAVGLDYGHNGSYSSEIREEVYKFETPETRKVAEQNWIESRRPRGLAQWLSLFGAKIRTLWFDKPDMHWTFAEIPKGIDVFYIVNLAVNIALWLMTLVTAAGAICRGSVNRDALLIWFAFLLYFGAHLFIEVQPRYRDFALPLLCILASEMKLSNFRRGNREYSG
jgi:hypothetical protein